MVNITQNDRDILQRLAEQQAEAAALPVQRQKAEMWRRLNDLEPVRPTRTPPTCGAAPRRRYSARSRRACTGSLR